MLCRAYKPCAVSATKNPTAPPMRIPDGVAPRRSARIAPMAPASAQFRIITTVGVPATIWPIQETIPPRLHAHGDADPASVVVRAHDEVALEIGRQLQVRRTNPVHADDTHRLV